MPFQISIIIIIIIIITIINISDLTYPSWVTQLVAQLVDVLRYKPEGRGFYSRWCHWKCSLT